MKKQKNTELNFLYMDEKYQNKGKKKKENNIAHKVNNKGQKGKNSAQDDIFNFDNEIVIGVTKPSKKKKEKDSKKNDKLEKRKSKQNKIKQNKIRKEEIKQIKKNKQEQNKLEKKIAQEEITQNREIQNKNNSNKTLPNKYYETIQVEVIKEKTGQEQKKKSKKTKNRKKNIEEDILNNKTTGKKSKRANQNIINQERKYKQNEQEIGNKLNKKNSIVKAIVKWTTLVIALIVAIIIFMMSPLFNIAQIEVVNNEKVSSETIISLSGIKIGENLYKNSRKQAQRNIKQNAYIESVKIDRKIPNKILITVKERKASFMLEYANSYAYINNQGYILEITEEKQNLPIIAGYVTNTEEMKEGNRLVAEDLEKLEMVLKIIESANGNGVASLITKINIQDKQNYIIELESQKKIVYLGDASNLSNRMLYLKAILEEEKDIEGEIFINGDLHKTTVYFRKKE